MQDLNGLVILKTTWWFTLERNYISVHNAASHSTELDIWKSIWSLILGISCTIVNNAANHLVLLEIWKDTWSLILGRSRTNVHNANTQPLKLVLWKPTLWLTQGYYSFKSLINAVSVDFLQSHWERWDNTKLWRKASEMFIVWLFKDHNQPYDEAHVESTYWRKAIQMRPMLSQFCFSKWTAKPQYIPHWAEEFQMQRLQQNFQIQKEPDWTWSYTHFLKIDWK